LEEPSRGDPTRNEGGHRGEDNDGQELTPDDLEEQNGEELPDREVMSVINPGADGIASTAPFEPLPLDDN
jgi:hypothetical protein